MKVDEQVEKIYARNGCAYYLIFNCGISTTMSIIVYFSGLHCLQPHDFLPTERRYTTVYNHHVYVYLYNVKVAWNHKLNIKELKREESSGRALVDLNDKSKVHNDVLYWK